MSGVRLRALGIDATAWFHDPVLRGQLSPRHWRRLPARYENAWQTTFAACRQLGVCATWFVPGEAMALAACQDLLRQLAGAGHEVALAGVSAAPLATLAAGERRRLERSWARAVAAIEAATGRQVVGFRAAWPDESAAPWWQDWLRDYHFAYDATPRSGAGERVWTVAGGAAAEVDCPCLPAWRLDPERPRLAGLPPEIVAAHYDVPPAGGPSLRALADSGAARPIAVVMNMAPGVAPVRPALAPEPAPAPSVSPRRLAVVVPLKDEASGIASLAVELAALRTDLADVAALEFVLVDDGSTDRTWELLQQHFGRRGDCALVQHARNRGIAAAIQTGIRASTSPLVASIDGDLSYDPLELRAMLELAGHADVVTASPYHPKGGVRHVPNWRLLLSRTLSSAYRLLLRSRLYTWTACFRVYRRAAVVDLPLTNPGFLGTAELLVRVLRRGGTVAEHPCVLEARLFGFSKMRVLRTIRGHLGLLWQVLLRRVR